MWGAALASLVEGLVRPLFSWLPAYFQGRNAEARRLAEAALKTQKEFQDVVESLNRGRQRLSASELRELFEREQAKRPAALKTGAAGRGSSQGGDGPDGLPDPSDGRPRG